MNKREGYGLVLAGGGGKGAYEIGVWKALLEAKGIKIGAVSGTSVGALNAALFAAGSYEKAEDIWIHINSDKILTLPKNREYLIQCMPIYQKACKKLKLKQKVMVLVSLLLKIYLKCHSGMFSRQGLIDIINDSNVAAKLQSAKIPCYATCFNLTEWRTQYFQLNDLPPEKILKVLLASSAIPFVFPLEDIGNAVYYDGGLPLIGDNVPVKPLYNAGWRKFIIVYLERDEIEKITEEYKGCQFIHIFPKNHQGGVFDGTLDFDPKSAKCRLEQGYKDLRDQIRVIDNFDVQLGKREQTADKMQADSNEYDHAMKKILELSEAGWEDIDEESKEGFALDDSEKVYEEICRDFSKNRSKMNEFMLKGVAAISAADALLDERHRKKGLENLFREISGKNRRLQHGIDKNLIHSQKSMIRMLSRLVESDVKSMELTNALQGQLYGSTYHMAKVLEEHGSKIDGLNNDFKGIYRKYNELVYQNKEIAGEVNRLYDSIWEQSGKTENMFRNIRDEIEELKDLQRLQNWFINLKFRQFYGVDYRELDTIGKVVCVVADFFFLTNGVWNDELLLFIKSGLDELGVEPYERMACGDVIYKLAVDQRYREYLFGRNGIHYVFRERENEIVTPCETLIQGVYICEQLANFQDEITERQIERYLADKNVSNEAYLSAFDVACMLLVVLEQYQECVSERNRLFAYRDIEKRALLGDVDAIQTFTRVLVENHYVDEAFRNITLLEGVMEGDESFRMLQNKVIEKMFSVCEDEEGAIIYRSCSSQNF